jgi:HEPN domain-containing protein
MPPLVDRFPPGLEVPAYVVDAAGLTDYAVTARYPGAYEEVDEEEYLDALRTAERVMLWAGKVLDS